MYYNLWAPRILMLIIYHTMVYYTILYKILYCDIPYYIPY